MKIAYNTTKRSKFIPLCEEGIRNHLVELKAGQPVHINLGSRGYNDRIVITISQNDRSDFDTNIFLKDPSRFPARIRATATALLNTGYNGSFEVLHKDGSLAIRFIPAGGT